MGMYMRHKAYIVYFKYLRLTACQFYLNKVV